MTRAAMWQGRGMPPTIQWDGTELRILDQRLLPHRVEFLSLTTCAETALTIRDMAVRGAPAIGCAAAFGMALAAQHLPDGFQEALRKMEEAGAMLEATRPTAVNLAHAVHLALGEARMAASVPDIAARVTAAAQRLLENDIAANREIGRLGAELLPENCTVLTHCNAGALATGGYGTALGIVRAAYSSGKLKHVFADETRPRLQGMQLTAWELMQDGIPVTVIPDGAAAALMRSGSISAVIVGADRIAANGDAANKIGTYGLAILARHHRLPFYVAAPTTTLDWTMPDGFSIPIEERASEEITHIGGVRVAPEGSEVWNPAFDVTPSELITAIVTEFGVIEAPSCQAMSQFRDRHGGGRADSLRASG